MKFAVDARALTTPPTGVGHYLLAAVNVWATMSPAHEFVLLAHKPLHAAAAPLMAQRGNLRFVCSPAALLPGNGLCWLVTHLETAARAEGADVLWGAGGLLPPLLRRGRGARLRSLLTVHDLAYRSLPWTLSRRARVAYGLLAGRSIRRADVLWAVSRYTAAEVSRHYPQRRAAEIAVGSGLNPLRAAPALDSAAALSLRQRYAVGDRSLLFVGTLEPRKNLRFLLGLMPALAARGYTLIVVGCAGWGQSGIAEVMQAPGFPTSQVRFCDYVPDADLQGLYRCVAIFVSTSLMEGFGLPQLEAMSAGCPVVAAANSAMVEVVGDGGATVEGWSPEAWVLAIEQVYTQRAAASGRALLRAANHDVATACRAVELLLAT